MGNAVSSSGHHAAAHITLPDLPSDTRVTQVTLLLRKLDEGHMNVVRGAENFFTGGRSHRTFEKWNTHYAIELELAGERMVIERSGEGIFASDRERIIDEVTTDCVRAGEMEDGKVVTLEDVRRYCEEQGYIPYNLFGKNCKHFAYDFLSSSAWQTSREVF